MKRFQLLVRQLRLRKTADRQTDKLAGRQAGKQHFSLQFQLFLLLLRKPRNYRLLPSDSLRIRNQFPKTVLGFFLFIVEVCVNLSKGENDQKPSRTMQHKQEQPIHERKHSKTNRLETGICNRLTVCRYNIILFHMVLVPLKRRRDAS